MLLNPNLPNGQTHRIQLAEWTNSPGVIGSGLVIGSTSCDLASSSALEVVNLQVRPFDEL